MKLPLWLLCLMPFCALAQPNQNQLVGLWVKCKAEMKDGSRVIDHDNSGERFLKYEFGSDHNVSIGTDPLFDSYEMPYKFLHDTLNVGVGRWVAEKSSPDTLRLRQVTQDTDISKIRVFYFANVRRVPLIHEGTYDAALRDSVYKATKFLFPECKDGFVDVMSNLRARDVDGRLTVHLVVDKTGHVKEVSATHNDSIPEKVALTIQKGFERSRWKPAVMNSVAVNVSMDVVLTFFHVELEGQKLGRVSTKYTFMPAVLPLGKHQTKIDIETSQSYFNTAAGEMQSGRFDKAAEDFSQCIETDEIDLESYYLRATCYQKMGDMKKACADWTKLAELGQTRAKEMLKKYCK